MRSEAAVSNEIELFAAYQGIKLMRNNSGACEDKTGRQIRYGLDNISSKHNKLFKSSDWIAPIPTFIEQRHVGMVLGVFGAIETKHEGWKFSVNDERAVAQARWMAIVKQAGGYAGFAQSTDDFMRIIGRG